MLHYGLTGTFSLFEFCSNVAAVIAVIVKVAVVGGAVVIVVMFYLCFQDRVLPNC